MGELLDRLLKKLERELVHRLESLVAGQDKVPDGDIALRRNPALVVAALRGLVIAILLDWVLLRANLLQLVDIDEILAPHLLEEDYLLVPFSLEVVVHDDQLLESLRARLDRQLYPIYQLLLSCRKLVDNYNYQVTLLCEKVRDEALSLLIVSQLEQVKIVCRIAFLDYGGRFSGDSPATHLQTRVQDILYPRLAARPPHSQLLSRHLAWKKQRKIKKKIF